MHRGSEVEKREIHGALKYEELKVTTVSGGIISYIGIWQPLSLIRSTDMRCIHRSKQEIVENGRGKETRNHSKSDRELSGSAPSPNGPSPDLGCARTARTDRVAKALPCGSSIHLVTLPLLVSRIPSNPPTLTITSSGIHFLGVVHLFVDPVCSSGSDDAMLDFVPTALHQGHGNPSMVSSNAEWFISHGGVFDHATYLRKGYKARTHKHTPTSPLLG